MIRWLWVLALVGCSDASKLERTDRRLQTLADCKSDLAACDSGRFSLWQRCSEQEQTLLFLLIQMQELAAENERLNEEMKQAEVACHFVHPK